MQASGISEGPVAISPSRSGGQLAREPPQQLHGQYRFDSASSYYNFPQRTAGTSISAGLSISTEFMPPAPITTGGAPILSGPQIPFPPMRRPVMEPEPGAPPSSSKVEMPMVRTCSVPLLIAHGQDVYTMHSSAPLLCPLCLTLYPSISGGSDERMTV